MTLDSTNAIRQAFTNKFSYSHKEWKPERYDEKITIDFRRILIAADAHIPRHNVDLIGAMLQLAIDQDIECIVWLGDLMDMEEFSNWGIDDASSNYTRNARYVGELLHHVNDLGFDQVWSEGNHERRITRATKGQIDMEGIAQSCGVRDIMDSGELIVSQHPTVLASYGDWMFTHPAQFGAPGITPGKLANRFDKNCVTAHEHAFSLGRDETDRFWTVSAGGLFQPEMHKYIQHNVTTHRAWVNGFCTIIDGVPRVYHGSEVL